MALPSAYQTGARSPAQDDARKLLAARYFVDAMTARVTGAALHVAGSRPADLDDLPALGRI